MEYRKLGSSGIKVSVLSYGSWVTFKQQIGLPEVKELMLECRNAGVNFFDNAETYASGQAEVLMGEAIKALEWKRSDLVLSTKIFWGGQGPNDKGLSRKHIIEGTKASLQRMQLDYVDLLYCHRPDPQVPIEETVRAMNWCIDHGLAFYWGTSEWEASQIEEAWSIANRLDLIGPAMEQPEFSMFTRKKVQQDYLPLYNKHGLGLTTWSPLAMGVLTGKYSGGNVPENSRFSLPGYKNLATSALVEKRHQLDIVDNLKPVAQKLGCSLAQLAIAWCAKDPHVSSVITGATKVEQLKENMAALEVIPKLTEDVMQQIEGIIQTKPTAA